MTTGVPALYQQVILDHYRRPRNVGPLVDAHHADGHNPLCGDRVTVYVSLSGLFVAEATFEGSGCAICVASASLMTESVRGRTVAEVDRLAGQVHDLVAAAPGAPVSDLGALAALAGVRQFPVRAKCALLPWRALSAAIHEQGQVTSTE
jgi:nitrogen fixation protein NifU and related proteins